MSQHLIDTKVISNHIVSLGSSCSVAFQQQRYGRRHLSLPFDWLQTDSLEEIVDCFESDFRDFTKFNHLTKARQAINFPVFDTESQPFPECVAGKTHRSLIIENKHRFRFCHDFNDHDHNNQFLMDEQIRDVSEKYQRRIIRLQTLMKTSLIHFIRDELKPLALTTQILIRLISLLDKLCHHTYHLTIILYNPTKLKIKILGFKHPMVTLIEDQSPWIDFKRSNFNWTETFRLNKNELNLDLSHKVNYRNKICINFFDAKKNVISVYNDEVCLRDLIDKVNVVLTHVNRMDPHDHKKFNYCVIEKSCESEHYAIKFVMLEVIDLGFMQAFVTHLTDEFELIAYQDYHGSSPLIYLSEETYFKDTYQGLLWYHQIDSFIQPIPELSQMIHFHINQWILKDKSNFLGISGEMGYYAKQNLEHLQQVVLLSNKTIRLEDCKRNFVDQQVNIHSVDYDQCQLMDYLTIEPQNWILLVNMSKGLQSLIQQVSLIRWKQILYIGCKSQYVDNDLKTLLLTHQVKHRVNIKLPNGSTQTILDLRPCNSDHVIQTM